MIGDKGWYDVPDNYDCFFLGHFVFGLVQIVLSIQLRDVYKWVMDEG